MNDFEKQLKDLRLAPPSPRLDRRMEELLAARPAHPAPLWWWLVLPAAGAAATSLVLMLRQPETVPQVPPPVYRVEAQGALRDWLLELPVQSQTPPRMIVSSGH